MCSYDFFVAFFYLGVTAFAFFDHFPFLHYAIAWIPVFCQSQQKMGEKNGFCAMTGSSVSSARVALRLPDFSDRPNCTFSLFFES